jgi:DNA-directed RNA polymerase I, II, and III subunit RPABC1
MRKCLDDTYIRLVHNMETQVRETERLWKAWTTVIEMLVDRKCALAGEDGYIMTLEEFESWVGNADRNASEARKTMYFTTTLPGGAGITVVWKELLGTSDVQEIMEIMDSEGIKRAIVIHNNKVTPYAMGALRLLRVQQKIIEVFTENELQYNVTHHEYVPKHIICSAETKKKIFDAYSIDATKIVKILSTDPVLRYLGAVKGQLIKIVRPSDSIPEVEIPIQDGSGKKEKKKLYDVTYKIVA